MKQNNTFPTLLDQLQATLYNNSTGATMSLSTPSYYILIIWFVLTTYYGALSDIDCLYNKCDFKLMQNTSIEHVPCLGTGNKILVRDVNCANGITYHICCNWPLRPDIQESRQKWFRKVTWAGSKVSIMCTSLVLCEQACKDGLRGDTRSNYPQLLGEDKDTDKRYVEAYNSGESAACYRQSNENYTDSSCEKDCHKRYSDCQKELDSSPFVKAYYDYSRAFHKLGMWSFDVWWAINDDIGWLIQNGTSVMEAVKKSVRKVMVKMNNMQESFKKFISTKQKRKRREEDANMDVLWNEFKVTFNETDPQIVQMTQNMKWDEFNNVFIIMTDILHDNSIFGDTPNTTNQFEANCLIITIFSLVAMNLFSM